MDRLDFAIYRFLSPQGEARFWAGRRLIDPTIPAREIAERVGISENGVRARLRGLTERGILRGTSVTPNPSLFGVRVYVAGVPVESAGQATRLFHDLDLVEGVVFARDTLDEGNREVRVHFVSESDSTTRRRATLLRRLSPHGQLSDPELYAIPPCERELSPIDWRLLRAWYRQPDATVAATAESVGLSLKTTSRRYHELVDSRACWWTHGPNSEELPLALIRVVVQDPAHREPVAGWILREAPDWMPVAADGLGQMPDSGRTVIAGLVPADAPAILERMVQKLADHPGVVTVHRTFGLGSKAFPTWFADRIAERTPARA
jgi:DNA-binding Lrp family transcriptional regulator